MHCIYIYTHTACFSNQEGHYRVQNGTLLQVCVDQRWETGQNTSQQLIDVVCSQQDNKSTIDQLVTDATQCPVTNTSQNTSASTGAQLPSTSSSVISLFAANGVLIAALLITAIGWITTCFIFRRKIPNKLLHHGYMI